MLLLVGLPILTLFLHNHDADFEEHEDCPVHAALVAFQALDLPDLLIAFLAKHSIDSDLKIEEAAVTLRRGLLLSTAFGKEPLRRVTTTSDLASLVRTVGGDRVRVNALSKGTQDPHQFAVLPSYMLKFRQADLFFLQAYKRLPPSLSLVSWSCLHTPPIDRPGYSGPSIYWRV